MRLDEIKIWKFNLIDMAIIFLVVVFALLIVSSKSSVSATQEESGDAVKDTKFTYTVLVNDIAENTGAMFRVGDILYDKVTSSNIGTITKIEINTAKGIFSKTDGSSELLDIPERVDVVLQVEADGRTKTGEYVANNLIRLMVGSFKSFKTKYVMFSGTITELD